MFRLEPHGVTLYGLLPWWNLQKMDLTRIKGAWPLFLTNVIKQTTFSVDKIKFNRTSIGNRVEAGLVTGPSHTTGNAVFRIRRLSSAVSYNRKVL